MTYKLAENQLKPQGKIYFFLQMLYMEIAHERNSRGIALEGSRLKCFMEVCTTHMFTCSLKKL